MRRAVLLNSILSTLRLQLLETKEPPTVQKGLTSATCKLVEKKVTSLSKFTFGLLFFHVTFPISLLPTSSQSFYSDIALRCSGS